MRKSPKTVTVTLTHCKRGCRMKKTEGKKSQRVIGVHKNENAL